MKTKLNVFGNPIKVALNIKGCKMHAKSEFLGLLKNLGYSNTFRDLKNHYYIHKYNALIDDSNKSGLIGNTSTYAPSYSRKHNMRIYKNFKDSKNKLIYKVKNGVICYEDQKLVYKNCININILKKFIEMGVDVKFIIYKNLYYDFESLREQLFSYDAIESINHECQAGQEKFIISGQEQEINDIISTNTDNFAIFNDRVLSNNILEIDGDI